MLINMFARSTTQSVLAAGLLLVSSAARAEEGPPPSGPAQPAASSVPSGAPSDRPPPASPGPAAAPGVAGLGASEAIVARGPVLRVPRGAEVREVALGCEGRAVLVVDSRAYVACGEDGVAVVTLEPTPALEGRIPTDGEAVGLFARAGKPWVELARTEARPLAGLRAAGPLVTAPAAPRHGTEARPAEAPAERPKIIAPPRAAGITEVSLGAAAFLTVGDLGVGTLAGAGIAHRFDVPFALRAEAYPIALATGKRGAAGAFSGIALASIDTTLFEIGLGLGGAKIPKESASGSRGTGSELVLDDGATIIAPTYVRIGARDGLYLSVRTSIIVRREEFAFGSIDVVGQIPVAERWALVLRGEGGNMGSASGLAAMRYRITETRGTGAAFVQGGAGYANVEGDPTCQTRASLGGSYTSCSSVAYSGPALAVSGEWRF